MKKRTALNAMIFCLASGVGWAQGKPTPEQIQSWPFEMRAQYFASQFLETLPNFVVTQQVTRMARASGSKDWQTTDTLEIELTFSHQKGDSSQLLKRNNKAVTEKYEGITGATSTGEFGAIIGDLFQAQFQAPKSEVFRNRRTMVFNFVIEKARINYLLTEKSTGQKTTTGLKGTVWIDAQSARILRIEYEATNIPASFPLSVSEHAIEYDEITVNGQKYMLPISAEYLVGSERTGMYQRNVTAFRQYRIFDTDLKIIPEDEPAKKKPD